MKTLFIIFSLILIFNQKVVFSQDLTFDSWLFELKAEARKQGISNDLLEKAFFDVKPIERILELDKKQPEFTLTVTKYLHNTVSKKRIVKGRYLLLSNESLLNRIEKKFNIPGNLIIALWGIETNFGDHSGSFSVISALTTLAFDGRRSAFFRKELINALKILNDGHVELSKMKGSWAGAMGQCQFMPSTFLQYAIDYNGDGKKDLWGSKEDALASAANYLSKMGWDSSSSWGMEVMARNMNEYDYWSSVGQLKPTKSKGKKRTGYKRGTMKDWSASFQNLDKSKIPESDIDARLLVLGEGDITDNPRRFFLVHKNFDVILKWNRSNFFGIAVGKLSDQIQYVK